MLEQLKKQYNLEPILIEKSSVGAGSDTFFLTCPTGKYVVKYPAVSEINHPEFEPELCAYLNDRGIPCCQFLQNRAGKYLTKDSAGRFFHVQRFIEGNMYGLNEAPDWLLTQSAQMLGKIHKVLKNYQGLPVGIGAGFFLHMTPESALKSYTNSLSIAESRGDTEIISDLIYRIELMGRFPNYQFNLDKLTCCATHGDYFISQILCGQDTINGVIDWTTACVHPVVWEIVRSYVYAAPSCRDGVFNTEEFATYVSEYLKYGTLNSYDLSNMLPLFYYQIAVCDYYGQYYASEADNRHIYLHQAKFSTKLMQWFDTHLT